jgi:hypothetical protein
MKLQRRQWIHRRAPQGRVGPEHFWAYQEANAFAAAPISALDGVNACFDSVGGWTLTGKVLVCQ